MLDKAIWALIINLLTSFTFKVSTLEGAYQEVVPYLV